MGLSPSFRPVGLAEVETLLPLLRAYWEYDGLAYEEGRVRRGLEVLVASPALGGAWLVEVAGAPVGYFILTWGFDLEFGGRHAWITDLYLEPQERGQGLGRAVFAFVDDLLRAEGVSCVELVVEHDNEGAMAFYRAMGFEPAERVPMARWLPGSR